MSDKPETSPRPWRLEYDGVTNRIEVIDAEGRPVCGWSAFNPYEADHHADANLIVAAVNERDRLRDIVRRFLDLFTQGTTHPAGTMARLLNEASAAIGEDAP